MTEDIFVIDSNTEEGSSSPAKYVLIDKEEDFIQENVFAKEIVKDPRWFQIVCEKDGLELSTQRQYFPDPATAQSNDTYKKSVSIKQGLLTNFLRKFLGDDAVVKATSCTELVEQIDAMCKPKYSTTPLRVKLELVEGRGDYAGKFFTNISTFAPFENMDTPKAKSKLFVSKVDKEKLAQKLAEDSVTPDSDTGASVDPNIEATF